MTERDVRPDAVAAWENVVRAVSSAHRRVLAGVERRGVASQEFTALHLLYRAADRRLPMSQLARELQMTSGGFTKLADRLGRAGLIDRRNSSDDRRVIFAVLTTQGAELVAETMELYLAGLDEHVLRVVGADGLSRLDELAGTLSAPTPDDRASEFRLPDAPTEVPHGRRAEDRLDRTPGALRD